MIACVDVDYRPEPVAACVLFQNWPDAQPSAEHVVRLDHAEPYVPGEFYRRELPPLMRVLADVPPLEAVVVDGYVWLGEGRPGLGAHLYEALGRRAPVIGVAKTTFHAAEAVAAPLLRGTSQRPLWVTVVGVDLPLAVDHLRRMHGPFRIPTLLKRVDQLCRTGMAR
jgi:deoxyribonuclease V